MGIAKLKQGMKKEEYTKCTERTEFSDQGEKDELMLSISSAIVEIQDTKEAFGIKSLSRHNPEKVARILYLHALGCSQTNMIRKHGISRSTIVNVLVDYADHTGSFRKLGGELAARSYVNLESLEEDMIDALREKLEGDYVPEFRDLKEISIAKANSQRQAMTAKGEASQVVEINNNYTVDDFNDTLAAARERIQRIKQADIIEAQEEGEE